MSKLKIWLDDERPAPDETWMKEKWPPMALHFIKAGMCDVISLDHDLGCEYTGYDVLKTIERWIAEKIIPVGWVPEIRIHTANPVGRKNMELALDSIRRLADAKTE